MLEWKEFGAWLAKGWHVDPEVRPSATEMLAEFEGLPGLSAWRHRVYGPQGFCDTLPICTCGQTTNAGKVLIKPL